MYKLLFIFLLLPSFVFAQDTTSVTWQHGPDYGVDTWVGENDKAKNWGTSDEFRIQSDIGFNRHILMLWDSIEIGIPNNATIISAVLSLIIDAGGGFADDSLVSIYRVTRLFTEGTVSGIGGITNYDSSSIASDNGGIDSMWTVAGGDFNSTKYATIAINTITAGDTVEFAGTLKTLVQGWVDQSFHNFGILIKFDTEDIGTAHRRVFISSDDLVGADRPWLTILYTVPSMGDVITRALGSILYRGRGQELQAARNEGKIINTVKKKGGS